MALTGTDRGVGSTNAAGQSTLVATPSGTIPVGALAVLVVAYDNSGTNGADPFSSIADSVSGNTWTSRQAALNDPGAASAGVAVRIFTSRLRTALTNANTITVSLGGITTVARAWALHQVDAAAGSGAVYLTGNVATGSSTTPTVTTASITSGQMVVGVMGAEGNAAITGDSDSTNGSWSTQQTSGIGTTTAGVEISSQRKVTTGTATQTYNLTITTADWAVAWVSIGEVADQTASPGTLSLTVTPQTPTVRVGQRVTPGTLALVTSPKTPSVRQDIRPSPGTLALVISPKIPTARLALRVTPGTLALAITPQAPTVRVGTRVTSGTIALAISPQAPSVRQALRVTPGTLAVVLAPQTPTARLGLRVTPGTLALTLTPQTPAVRLGLTARPGTLALAITPQTPYAVVAAPDIANGGAALNCGHRGRTWEFF